MKSKNTWDNTWDTLPSLNLNAEQIMQCKEAGWDLNETNPYDGTTVLHKVAGWINATKLQAYIDAGADVNMLSKNQETPLFAAVRNNNAANTRVLLLNGAKTNIQNKEDVSPLYLAILAPSDDQIIHKKHLSTALLYPHREVIEILLQEEDPITHQKTDKANPNLLDKISNTPLQRVLFATHHQFTKIPPNRIDLLIKKGLNLNHQNKLGNTLMHMIVQQEQILAPDLKTAMDELRPQLFVILSHKPNLKLLNRDRESVWSLLKNDPKNHIIVLLEQYRQFQLRQQFILDR